MKLTSLDKSLRMKSVGYSRIQNIPSAELIHYGEYARTWLDKCFSHILQSALKTGKTAGLPQSINILPCYSHGILETIPVEEGCSVRIAAQVLALKTARNCSDN